MVNVGSSNLSGPIAFKPMSDASIRRRHYDIPLGFKLYAVMHNSEYHVLRISGFSIHSTVAKGNSVDEVIASLEEPSKGIALSTLQIDDARKALKGVLLQNLGYAPLSQKALETLQERVMCRAKQLKEGFS